MIVRADACMGVIKMLLPLRAIFLFYSRTTNTAGSDEKTAGVPRQYQGFPD